MFSEVKEHQTKERQRTRWTRPLDKIFADLVVEQIQLGNRPNNIFDKKTWGNIRDEFNKKTNLNFNNNQLRKHLDVLRTRYTQVKSSLAHNDFIMDDASCPEFDLWEGLGVNPRPEPVKIKDCPIYEQLCTIFADNDADGSYAQSSHYEELKNKSSGDNVSASGLKSGHEITETPTPEVPLSSRSRECNAACGEKGRKSTSDNKRKHLELNQSSQHQKEKEILDSMAKVMLDMIEASKLSSLSDRAMEDAFSITNCIKALDKIEGLDESVYFAALDLFNDPFLRQTFVSLASMDNRSRWLQEKCSAVC